MERIRVGVIGYGYWGPNLIRNFTSCPLTEVVAVCDASPARQAAVKRTHPGLAVVSSVDELLDLQIDAVAIATPVSTHYSLAMRCLEAGKDVLVEKPLAGTVREAQALADKAERLGRILMVDHTYLFSNTIRRMKQLVESGELGDLHYLDSVRINLGLFQSDINVIWDLAPHDLAITDFVLGLTPRSISAWGCAHADPLIEDIAYVNVDYGDRLMANFHVNWLSPVKVRQMILAGSKKSLIFNELNPSEPLKVYDRGIEVSETDEESRRLRVGYRTGDMWSPHIEPGEALQAVVTHFAECIRDKAVPISDGRTGVRVVRLLEAATRSIRAQGGRVVLSTGEVSHADGGPRASDPANYVRVSQTVQLGRNVVIHCFANLYGCLVGDETRIGAFVEIQAGACIGSRCKISSHTFVCSGVTIEDEVFIGHGVMFTNDLDPRATNEDGDLQSAADWQLVPTRVCRGASIGSGAIILPGVTIGEGALVGAGAVVTRNVEPRAVVAGCPARFLRLRGR